MIFIFHSTYNSINGYNFGSDKKNQEQQGQR